MSGDNSVAGLRTAVREIVKNDADEYFVFLLSDANLDQYNIKASDFTALINGDRRVNVYILFIGTLGDQAKRLTEELPPGHVFICLETSDIPKVGF